MSSCFAELTIVLPQKDATYSETSFGSVPHGYVQRFAVEGQEPLITSQQVGDTTTFEIALPQLSAAAVAAYWQLYGTEPQYRNCHSFAHIGSGLVGPDTLSHNLLDVERLLLDDRDAADVAADPLDLTPGAAYAVTDHHIGHSKHSMLAIAAHGLILDVNGSHGEMRVGSAQNRIQGYEGTGLHRLRYATPALGTDYWMTGRLTPASDPRHVDVIVAEQLAQTATARKQGLFRHMGSALR